VKSASREEAEARLAPLAAGCLLRRGRPREEVLASLPEIVKALVSSRRALRGGGLTSWMLRTLSGRGLLPSEARPSPAGERPVPRKGRGSAEELASEEGLAEGVLSLLAGCDADDRAALELLAVEGLTAAEAGELLGAPGAVVEQRASRAFALVAEKVLAL
jgi:DNA-directed RNA polymerase specialized sigma24 family protein